MIDCPIYSPGGRGFPDIAARGNSFQVVVSGTTVPIDGTSASSPVRQFINQVCSMCVLLTLIVLLQAAAGLISLLNDYRISHGNPSLGFLNPFLYSKGLDGLIDIVVCDFPRK